MKDREVMSMNGKIPPELTDHLTQAKQLAANRLLRPNYFANVVGVGIGKKVVSDDATPTYCVRVYVVSKLDLEDLSPAATVPSSFLDVPTDIIEVGRFGRTGRRPKPAQNQGKGAEADPTPRPGSPISVKTNAPNVNQGFLGTLGALVQAGPGPNDPRYILSCNHVLAVNGRVPQDAEIVLAEFVGEEKTLADPGPFVPLQRDGSNSVDCAVARLKDLVLVLPAFPKDTLTLSLGAPIDPLLDMQVKKVGAATGPTAGKIVDVDADLYIDYSFGTFRFEHQVMIDSGSDDADFAALGDSGSLVVDTSTKRSTAMIFAASGRFAVACPLGVALEKIAAELKVPKLSVVV